MKASNTIEELNALITTKKDPRDLPCPRGGPATCGNSVGICNQCDPERTDPLSFAGRMRAKRAGHPVKGRR